MNESTDIILKPSMLYAFLKALPLISLAFTFLFLAFWLSPYFILFSLVVCGLAWYRLLYIRSFKYQITTEYILLTEGIFFKRIDQVELFRVKDYIITQSFIMQICKLMYLTLKSTDAENATIRFQGIPESNIIETIRERVLEARKSNNIYELN
jgi:uncharacterized membrane protein YdbT with pleckstrin-like domain